ncbi:MAG: hypothetical protein LBR73_07190 [Oscillospiraceae bacterium]|jgi:hypothetical protein|nr:hypothetical protein [Oscillospiraceae bacterium]
MRQPKFSGRPGEVQQALRKQDPNARLAPNNEQGSGELVVFKDLTADGKDEAIFCYTVPEGGSDDSALYLAIYAGAGDDWEPLLRPALLGDKEVFRLDCRIADGQPAAILLERSDSKARFVTVYALPSTVAPQSDLVSLCDLQCSLYRETDLNSDGYADIAFIYQRQENGKFVSQVGAFLQTLPGQPYAATALTDISEATSSAAGFIPGYLRDGSAGLYVDLGVDNGYQQDAYSTAVFAFDEQSNALQTVFGPGSFPRSNAVASRDINSDGIIDVPADIPIPGSSVSWVDGKTHTLSFTAFYSIDAEGSAELLENHRFYFDSKQYVNFPPNMPGKVTVSGTSDDLQFGLAETGEKLFSININYGNTGQLTFNTAVYKEDEALFDSKLSFLQELRTDGDP